MSLDLLLHHLKHFIGHRAKTGLEDLPPFKEDSSVLETPREIMERGISEYANSISAVRSYHQHRASFKHQMDDATPLISYNSYMDQLSDGLNTLMDIAKEIEKRASGFLDYRLAGLYLALMDGSDKIFDDHAEIKKLLDSGINVDFVAGFWFLFSFGNTTFECTYVDPGRSLQTFDGLDEASRTRLISSVHRLRNRESESLIKSNSIITNPNTDYFTVIAEPEFHKYKIKMFLPCLDLKV